jgi:hypothetical protein
LKTYGCISSPAKFNRKYFLEDKENIIKRLLRGSIPNAMVRRSKQTGFVFKKTYCARCPGQIRNLSRWELSWVQGGDDQ